MLGTMSGDLVGWSKFAVCNFRRKLGISADKSRSTFMKLRLDGKWKSPEERAIEEAWGNEWKGVVENYWRALTEVRIAQITDPKMAGLTDEGIRYHLYPEHKARSLARLKRRAWRLRNDPNFKLKKNLRNHVARICRVSKTKKTRRTIEYIGCTIPEARRHIEKQFRKGMAWSNHGDVWEIDHIIPLSAFDLTREDQRMRANHFTNLRPLSVRENRQKRDAITQSHQIALL
jgi:hypothetical protein